MDKLQHCIFLLFVVPYLSEAARILSLFPFPTRSHDILGEGFNRILLKAGHEITYVTPFPKSNSDPNMRYVDVSENLQLFPTKFMDIKSFFNVSQSAKHDFAGFFKIITNLSNATLTNRNVQKILNDPNERFDLIIIEWMYTDVFTGLSLIYDCPYVWSSSMDPHWGVLSLIDEAPNPAYVPDTMSSNIPPFNFLQRVEEFLRQYLMVVFKELVLGSNYRQIYNDVFGPLVAKKGKTLPPFDEVQYNASLMFGNSHVSLGKSIRLPQNYIPIGGYHIDPDVKPLPEDLKKIMDNAENGVVYFSMGSSLKSKDLPVELKEDLLNMFGSLKYTVIWKFEEQMANLPKNVHILQWAPQPSILAHPNCKVFITHGGALSV